MTHELFQPIRPRARAQNGIVTRIAAAMARPWLTSYVCPTLRTIEAVAYAVRGYDVWWTEPRLVYSDVDGTPERDPSMLRYLIYDETPDGRYASHGVEPRGFFPDWMVRAECGLRNAMMRRSAARACR